MTGFDFRWMLMVVCVVIFLLSFGVLIWKSWKHHRGETPERVNFHSSLAVEIAWTVAPCIIVLLLVWPTARIFWTP
jgi:cytochrome c oxidase subunit 2